MVEKNHTGPYLPRFTYSCSARQNPTVDFRARSLTGPAGNKPKSGKEATSTSWPAGLPDRVAGARNGRWMSESALFVIILLLHTTGCGFAASRADDDSAPTTDG